MPDTAAEDLSPADFVKKIRELGDKRDREDAERFALLEQEIEKGREERAARRAGKICVSLRLDADSTLTRTTERARSISPEKSVTPPYSSLRNRNSPSPSPQPSHRASMVDGSQSPTSLARSGTLSWQQRPKSSSGRRPLSLLAAENAARSPRATPDNTADNAPEPSRAQIAESLASKDPAWFRQTADRGTGSAAYRRSQDEPVESTGVLEKRGLPGMSQELQTVKQGSMSPPPEDARSTSPSRSGSVKSTAGWDNRFSATSAGSDGVKSPLDRPKLTPTTDTVFGGRSPSPTKGMGGFVQSAMMKRSDSVSKRWSAQAPPGISRHNSSASNRSGYGGSSSMPRLDGKMSLSPSREASNDPGSRPSSSHSKDDQADIIHRDGLVQPSIARMHSRSKSVASMRNSIQPEKDDSSQPPSPSKRWSPTKSSWLESALSKEEKPKPKVQPPPAQPVWMTEMNKAKEQKSAALGDKSSSNPTNGLPKAQTMMEKSKSPPPEPAVKPTALAKVKSAPAASESKKTPSPTVSPKPVMKARAEASQPTAPGKFDFRANLKSRATLADANKNEEPEFKNALGKLRRAETKNYIAPDTFKDNIMRGKAALNLTGGPAKRERVDELKDSILKKKQEMQQKVETEGPTKPEKHVESATPEAVARREMLSRTDSFGNPPSKKESQDSALPEFLAKQKTMKEKAKQEEPFKPISNTPKEAPRQTSTPPQVKTSLTRAQHRPAAMKAMNNTPSLNMAPEPPISNLTDGGLKAGASSKLANRFNPALAGILARGPSPMSGNRGADGSVTVGGSSSVQSNEPGEPKKLSHMTKGRARGPKRRAPKAIAPEPTDERVVALKEKTSTPLLQQPAMASTNEVASHTRSKPDSTLPTASSLSTESVSLTSGMDGVSGSLPRADMDSETAIKPKPVAPSKSPLLSRKGWTPAEESENVVPNDIGASPRSLLHTERSPLWEKGSEATEAETLPLSAGEASTVR